MLDGGVFKSTNGGESWNAVWPQHYESVYAMAIDPKAPATLYAGTSAGLLKSTNGGEDWSFSVERCLPQWRLIQ